MMNCKLSEEQDPNVLLRIYTSAYSAYSSLQTSINLNYRSHYEDVEVKDYQSIYNEFKNLLKNKEYSQNIYDDIENANKMIKTIEKLSVKFLQDFHNDFDLNGSESPKVILQNSYFFIASEMLLFGTKLISNVVLKGETTGKLEEVVKGIVDGATGLYDNNDYEKLYVSGNPIDYVEYEFNDNDLWKPCVNKSKVVDLVYNCNLDKNKNKVISELKEEFVQNPIEFLQDNLQELQINIESINKDILPYIVSGAVEKDMIDMIVNSIDFKKTSTKSPEKFSMAISNLTAQKISQLRQKEKKVNDTLKKKKADDKIFAKKLKEDLKTSKNALNAVGAVLDLARVVVKINQLLIDVERALTTQNVLNVGDLKKFVKKIFKNFQSSLSNAGDLFANANSHPVLDKPTFKIKKSLDEMIRYFRFYFTGSEHKGTDRILQFFNQYDQLREAIESICGRILVNGEKLRLASLITNTSLVGGVQDKYKTRYTYMEQFTTAMILLREGNEILYTSTPIFFPQSIDYAGTFQNINSTIQTSTTNFLNNADVQTLLKNSTTGNDALDKVKFVLNTVVKGIHKLRKSYEHSKYSLQESRKYLYFSRFDSSAHDKTILKSFFICRDKDKLLNWMYGNPIQVRMDINSEDTPLHIDAVKFTEISIKLKYVGNNNDYKQYFEIYDKSLRAMTVEMTSSGYYDYKFNGIIYRIKNAVINPSSNYGDTLHGRNEDYINISNAAPLFSPYTTWTIRLIDVNSNLDESHTAGILKANLDLMEEAGISKDNITDYELHFVGVGTYLKNLSFLRPTDDIIGISNTKNLYSEVKISKDYEAFRISNII